MNEGPTRGATARSSQWSGRPRLAIALRVALAVLPLVVAAAVTVIAGSVVGRPRTIGPLILWWVAISTISTLTLTATARALRRFLPIVALLRLSLVFPDEAPSRFRLALRSGTVNQLATRHSTSELDPSTQASAETLLLLVGRLGEHDRLTRGHSERVRAYADLIGEEMRLPVHERELLHWSALLHDIGKLEVPAAILNKKGAPDDAEWQVIKNHPAAAAQYTASLADWLGEWRHAAQEHHERWEGGGYPRGVAGTDITLAGRIVAVADAYDTITSVRSYKPAMSAEDARSEIARCSGTQFDPAVVRAFLAISLGDLRRIMGPLAWLTQVPILASIPSTTVPAVSRALTSALAAGTVAVASIAGTEAGRVDGPDERVAVARVIGDVDGGNLVDADPDRPTDGITPSTSTAPTTTTVSTTVDPSTTSTSRTSPTPDGGPEADDTPTSSTAPPPSTTSSAAGTPTSTVPPVPTTTTTSTTTTTTVPPASLDSTYWLASPGSGDTASSPVLTMDSDPPVAGPLPNFDTDRDGDPGLMIKKGEGEVESADSTKVQVWKAPSGGPRTIGSASLRLYAAPKDFDWDKVGVVRAILQRCATDLSSCATLATTSRSVNAPGGSSFVAVDLDFGPIGSATTATQPVLVVRVIVPPTSEDDLWLAYGTATYPARLAVSG